MRVVSQLVQVQGLVRTFCHYDLIELALLPYVNEAVAGSDHRIEPFQSGTYPNSGYVMKCEDHCDYVI